MRISDWSSDVCSSDLGTKAFVRQFSLCLRSDLHGKGVRVTSIEPGLVETEFMLVRYLQDENAADAVYRHASALKPEDLADTLHWVAEQPPHVNVNRSEEHTSELQSLMRISYAVFCLKKKQTTNNNKYNIHTTT